MSIVDQISRLRSAKSSIRSAIIAKGVDVPPLDEYIGGRLSDYATYISQIQTSSSNIKTGTLTITSDKTSSVDITTISQIGFTPKVFILMANTKSTTRYAINQAVFVKNAAMAVKFRVVRSSSSDTVAGTVADWTSSTTGYLYLYNNSTIRFVASSSYRLVSGTYSWIAIS